MYDLLPSLLRVRTNKQIVVRQIRFLPASQDAGNRIAFPSLFEIFHYIKKEHAKVPSLTSSVYEYQLWKPDLVPQFGTPIWDPNLGPQFETPIWDPDFGPQFWTQVGTPIWGVLWYPDMGPPFGTLIYWVIWGVIWDPDWGPRLGTPIWDPDLRPQFEG
jgi:hypothetical protein